MYNYKTLFTWSGGPRSSGVSFFCFVSPSQRTDNLKGAMEQGVVMISEKHRRMLISLSMIICLLAVIVLVIAKDHAAKVSKPEAAVQGKRTLLTF